MNQLDIIKSVANKTGLSLKHAKGAVQAVVDIVQAALVKGANVRTGLGTFAISKRGARKGRNPKTGEAIKIAASKAVRFKASKSLKDRVNKRMPTKKPRAQRAAAAARGRRSTRRG